MVAPETWATRVAEWRASGQTSTDYAEGKGFSAGGLRPEAVEPEGGQQAHGRVGGELQPGTMGGADWTGCCSAWGDV